MQHLQAGTKALQIPKKKKKKPIFIYANRGPLRRQPGALQNKAHQDSEQSVRKCLWGCRGYITRKKLGRDPCLDAAAAHIQNVWRRHQGRKSGLLRICKMQQARDTRFLQLQDSLVRYAHQLTYLPCLKRTFLLSPGCFRVDVHCPRYVSLQNSNIPVSQRACQSPGQSCFLQCFRQSLGRNMVFCSQPLGYAMYT